MKQTDTRAMTRLLAAALALGLASTAAGHTGSHPSSLPAELRFDSLDIRDGLAQNTVTAIAQDQLGLMWLGTVDGLHRFDGYEFTAYRKSGTPGRGLQSSTILALFADSRGTLWIGTHDGGLHRMNTVTGEIVPVPTAPPAASPAPAIVWDITEDADGRIWFVGNGGAGRVDADGGNLVLLEPPAGFGAGDVWAVRQDASGAFWAFGDNLAARFDAPGGKWQPLAIGDALGLPAGEPFHVGAVGSDDHGRLVVAVAGHLLTLGTDGVAAAVTPLPEDPASGTAPAPRDILADGRGNLWISTSRQGLLRLSADGVFSRYRHDPFLDESLAADRLSDLFLDRGGLLWIGTDIAGVDRFDPATVAIRHYRHHPMRENSLGGNSVWSFARRSDGPLWVSADDGLNRLDLETGRVARYQHEKKDPSSVAPGEGATLRFDEDGRLWIAKGTALDQYLPESDGFEHHPLPADLGWLMNFLPLGDSRLLLGAEGGLGVFDASDDGFTPLAIDSAAHPALAHAYTIALARSPDGTVWIGSNLGLLAWDGRSAIVQDVMHGAWEDLYNTEVQDVTVLADGGIAVATEAGLAVLGDEPGATARWYTEAHGMPAGMLYAVREDRAGDLWVSSNAGLLRIDPVSGQVDHFDHRDGLQSDEFNGGAALVDADGNLYFGGINGFNVFDPLELSPRNVPPEVVVTRVSGIGGNRMPAAGDGRVEVDWRQNAVTFEFMAADFAAPRSNRFQVRLLPLHREWMPIREDHRAAYADIPGGNYVFEVRAAAPRGAWSEPARVELSVGEKPWRTWWAWTLYVAAALGLLLWFLRHQAQKLAAQQAAIHETQQRQKAQSLYELAASLSRTLHAGEIPALLFKHVKRSVEPDFVALYALEDHAANVLRLDCAAPEREADVRAFADTRRGFVDALRETMDLRVLPGAELAAGDEVRWLQAFQLLAIPMRDSAGRFLFLLLGRRGRPFDGEDAARVAGYANQALVALDKARLFEEVQALATKDELTGISNRRHLYERAELEFQRCIRYRRPFAVLMIDFDHFKTINDHYGHDAGDQVLREAGQLFERQLRKFDLVARYGGEEFIMCLPETTLEQARIVADRVRCHVERLRIPVGGRELAVTASIGAASSEPAGGELQEVILAADAALYAAKAGGRNRVESGEVLPGG